MLLLYVSDIHLREPECGNPELDAERPFRTRLLQDARRQTETLGSVGAILVGGDIAYKGHPHEYDAALTWLLELAAACGCPKERIYVVPGNHDVDRRHIAQTPSVRNVQQAIRFASDSKRERELLTQFRDPDAGRFLLAPLSAYNAFATRFDCQLYPPHRLCWTQEIELNDEVRLRMYGLNSTLLSGYGGSDDTRGQLYLSPLQTIFDPVDDVVNLLLCHHPPDWFMDSDEINDAIAERVHIQMFGHRHRQRVTFNQRFARFDAGAVNPERYQPGWRPGYTLVKLEIAGYGHARVIDIEAHIRDWQSNPEMFRPVMTQSEETVHRHRIPFPARRIAAVTPVPPSNSAYDTNFETAKAVPAVAANAVDVEAQMSDATTRNLVYRFWNLTISQRREIASSLKLIGDDEMKLDEPERYGRALRRAAEKGLLDQLEKAIAEKERK